MRWRARDGWGPGELRKRGFTGAVGRGGTGRPDVMSWNARWWDLTRYPGTMGRPRNAPVDDSQTKYAQRFNGRCSDSSQLGGPALTFGQAAMIVSAWVRQTW